MILWGFQKMDSDKLSQACTLVVIVILIIIASVFAWRIENERQIANMREAIRREQTNTPR
jgi:predicted negative regulator of RcsB-dependent stress response